MTERKNPDYTDSAVNLSNPKGVIELLQTIHVYQNDLKECQKEIDDFIPERLLEKRKGIQGNLDILDTAIKTLINDAGSYQDTVKGEYALKQRRQSFIYLPHLVRQYAPSPVAYAVITEAVDLEAMANQIKAGAITPEEAGKCGKVKETYAYIIKCGYLMLT